MKQRRSLIASLVLLGTMALIVLFVSRAPLGKAQEQKLSLEREVAALKESVEKLTKNDEQKLNAISALSLTDPPVGTIMAFAGEFPPYKDREKNIK